MVREMGGWGIRRNYEIPGMNSGDKMSFNHLEKAEHSAQTFRKVHSSGNLTQEANH